MSPSDWVAVTAAVAAWLATWFAFRSAQASHKSYRLALEQDQRRRPAIELYLADSHFRTVPDGGCRIYVFDLVITNRSDAENAIQDLRLAVDYRRGHGPNSNFFVSHNPNVAADLPDAASPPLRLPSQLAPHGILAGRALFRVPEELIKAAEVDSYTLTIVDTYGIEVSREIVFLRREMQ